MQKPNQDKDSLETRFAYVGDVVMREGEVGTHAFLLKSGKVEVYTEKSGSHVTLAQLGPGQIFGEMALLSDAKRVASVRAIEDSDMVIITRDMLQQKIEKSDPTIRAIITMLMQRLSDTSSALTLRTRDVDGAVKAIELLYQDLDASYTGNQKRLFEGAVLPKLDALLNEIRNFKGKYKKS